MVDVDYSCDYKWLHLTKFGRTKYASGFVTEMGRILIPALLKCGGYICQCGLLIV